MKRRNWLPASQSIKSSAFKIKVLKIILGFLIIVSVWLIEVVLSRASFTNFKKSLLWRGWSAGAPFPRHQPDLGSIQPHMAHCLTSQSPGSPQTPSGGTAVLPDVASLVRWNSTSEHEQWTPSNTLLQHSTHQCNGLSLSADVVWLWNSMCVLSMMSACVCVCACVCSIWKGSIQYMKACKCACAVQWMTHYRLLVICPGTHKNQGQALCVTPCAFTGFSAMYTTCRRQEEWILFTKCVFRKGELGYN